MMEIDEQDVQMGKNGEDLQDSAEDVEEREEKFYSLREECDRGCVKNEMLHQLFYWSLK